MLNINIRLKLAGSLLDLLNRETIDVISVRQITDNCGLPSRTFYNHFRDKFDLMDFLYFISSEQCWFRDGKVCVLSEAYTRHLEYRQLPANVFRNMYHYVGQNDIRYFGLKKTRHDMKRMFYYNHAEELLENTNLLQAIEMVSYGICGMFERRIYDSAAYVPSAEVIISSFPEEYRWALLKDPYTDGRRPDIPLFNPATCCWPPELY